MKRFRFILAIFGFLLGAAPAAGQDHFASCISRTAENAVIIIPAAIAPNAGGAPLASGDEIAVVTPAGLCAGVAVWTAGNAALTAWAADEYSNVGGFASGDTLRFKLWDASEGFEYDLVAASYASGQPFLKADGLFESGAIYELTALAAAPLELDLEAPALVFPADLQNGIPASPTLSWTSVTGAVGYRVQLSGTADFSSTVVDTSGLTSPHFAAKNLGGGETYYWRAAAVTSSGAGPYSAIRSFTTLASVQHVALEEGWNLVSSHVVSGQTSLDSLFASLAPNAALVKDDAGRVFWPEASVNDIGSWNIEEAYQIFMEAPGTLTFSGTSVAPEATPLGLQAGWNMVAYLPGSAQAPGVATASLGDNLVVVKDEAGNVFMPEYGIDGVGALSPGSGYKMYLNEAATLIYPASGSASKTTMSLSDPARDERLGYSAHLLVKASEWAEGSTLTAWSGERLVGRGTVEGGMAVLTLIGDDPYTDGRAEGATGGAPLVLRAGEDGAVQVPQIIRDILTGASLAGVIYEDDAVYEVTLGTEQSAGQPQQFALEQNYPNPFNVSTTIRYALTAEADVRLELFNVLGQRLRVLAAERQKAGSYEVILSTGDLPSGMYLYRLQAGENTATRTMTLMK